MTKFDDHHQQIIYIANGIFDFLNIKFKIKSVCNMTESVTRSVNNFAQ